MLASRLCSTTCQMDSFHYTDLKRKKSMSDKNKLDHLTDQLARDYLYSPELIEVSFMTRLG